MCARCRISRLLGSGSISLIVTEKHFVFRHRKEFLGEEKLTSQEESIEVSLTYGYNPPSRTPVVKTPTDFKSIGAGEIGLYADEYCRWLPDK
jgi:hypothetical protein